MRRDTVITLSVITGLVVLGSWLGQPEPPVRVADERPVMTVQQLENMNAQAEAAAVDAVAGAAADAAAAALSDAPPVAPPVSLERLTRPYYELPQDQLTFNGYPCTEDCSGHQAGYEWADRNWITDPADCWNHSQSFEQGCMSWIEEQAYAAGCSDDELDAGTCEW